MKNLFLFLFTCTLFAQSLLAQRTITGTVTDENNQPLPGASVIEKGTSNGTTADFDGNYHLNITSGKILVISYTGYNSKDVSVGNSSILNIKLQGGVQLEEVKIVGSRSPKRTVTDTAVPIDVINLSDITSKTGQVEITQLLQNVAPSFNASRQSGSDGADHIVPATLRGLGPDQTLVLINGKRRHQSSLINLFGTRGRGNTGTDLNAIPASAIKRIEILRDGAAAQYGSDAIAGVINIVLKDKINEVSGSVSYGAYNTNAKGDFSGYQNTSNIKGNRLDTNADGNKIGKDKDFDGGSVKLSANYGVKVGDRGFANFTTEYAKRNKTLRPGYEWRRGAGSAAMEGFAFFVNSVVPINDKTEFYAFGGKNFRNTDAFAYTRNNPTERNVTSIYPNGFTPRITSIITDNSVSAGIRTKTESGWHIDFNNTYGINNFHYFIKGTLNASLGNSSPTDFDAGGHQLSQNTTGLDFSKYFKNIMSGLNIALGLEYRTENFQIFAGEPGSYGTFDTNGIIITNPNNQSVPIDPITNNPRPGGSQGFPGYSPSDVVNRSRTNLSSYLDSELDITDKFLVAAALRFERYSDFGSTTNGKLALRYKVTNNINLRGSVSTGFRAPSLAQIYYNLHFTQFINAIPVETLLSPNNSPITKAFGIQKLKQETSTNESLGFVATFGNFTATLDGYHVIINNRIVLTGSFDASSLGLNVDKAKFFANGVNTESTGLDAVISWKKLMSHGSFNASLIGNINNMTILDVKNGNLDADTFFEPSDRTFLIESAPKNKFVLDLRYDNRKFNIDLATTRFSKVVLGGNLIKDTYNPKVVADLNLGFKLSKNFKLDIGGKNILNQYPSIQNDTDNESGSYWDSVQMGYDGAFYYTRLGFNF